MNNDKEEKWFRPVPEPKPDNPIRDLENSDNTLPTFLNPPPPPPPLPPKEEKK